MSGALLTFDPEPHTYTAPDGAVIPSVTQILKATGVSTDFDSLMEVSARLRASIAYARALGKAVHADCHAFDDGDLDLDQVHAVQRPYVEAWRELLALQSLVPMTRERILYAPSLGVCGTLDGIFIRRQQPDHRILLDIKLGDPHDAAAQFQTAGYDLLWTEEHPDQPIAERWSVQLVPERTVPYRIEPYTDWTDHAKFRAFVTTYYEQAARRVRARRSRHAETARRAVA